MGHRSAFVFASAGGCWWGTYGVGQELWGRGGAREEKMKLKGWLRVAEIPRLRGVS